MRDESHRFAIEFQRVLRSKQNFASILEELPGIGPGKRRALLAALGSLRAVREAPIEVLAAVPGISRRDAQTIAGFFAAMHAPMLRRAGSERKSRSEPKRRDHRTRIA